MSAADKANEQNTRPEGDYALSWIRREGRGAIKPNPEHLTAGPQHVLGDPAVDDSPSARGATK